MIIGAQAVLWFSTCTLVIDKDSHTHTATAVYRSLVAAYYQSFYMQIAGYGMGVGYIG